LCITLPSDRRVQKNLTTTYTAKELTVAQQYEAGLVARYGQEYVDWLNGPHEMTNYRREDFIRIRDEYRAKLKALKQREAA
ncbi:recombination protein NinG, partial [Klebsiella pneumoniae]